MASPEFVQPHRACIHVLFDKAEGPDQTLWVDDVRFGYVAEMRALTTV